MMTSEERIHRIEALGYLRPEAEFLVTVALHSGFFLRRHYLEYLGASRGSAVRHLIAKMIDLKHGRTLTLGDNTQVCHLFSKSFYRAIGEPDNRNQRMRPEVSMRVKLMALEYVLTHPGPRYLATEKEKTDFFCSQLGLPRSVLPRQVYRSLPNKSLAERYFPDKFPIFIPAESSAPLVVSFCYIDQGYLTTPGFQSWLTRYSQLFDRLSAYRVIFVSTTDAGFAWAERRFRRFLRPLASRERLLAYFELEDAFRKRDFSRLDVTKLEELRRLRDEFPESQTERMFDVWQEVGKDAVLSYLGQTQKTAGEVLFSTCRVAWRQSALPEPQSAKE